MGRSAYWSLFASLAAIGLGLIGFALLLLVAGVLWMQKIINIEV